MKATACSLVSKDESSRVFFALKINNEKMEIIFIATLMQAIIVIILVAIVLVGGRLALHSRTHKLLHKRSAPKKMDSSFLDFD